MKLELEFQIASLWSAEEIKQKFTSEKERRAAVNAALELQSEYDNILERNGFSRFWNTVIFGSDEFYRALDVAENFGLQFLLLPKLTKKELDLPNAFVVKASSILPIKHDIIYALGSNLKPLPSPYECVPIRDDIYKIYIYKHTGIVGKYEKWKDDFFKSTEYLTTNLIITDSIKKLLLEYNIRGVEFEPLLLYNLRSKNSAPIEGIYDTRPTRMLQYSFLANTLLSKESRKDPECIFFNQIGTFLFQKGAFGEMDDVMFMNLPTSKYRTNMVASQRFRSFYLKNKLKGLRFMPIFETETDLFDEYDFLVAEFAKDLIKRNPDHRIGYELIDPHRVVDGLNPKPLTLKND